MGMPLTPQCPPSPWAPSPTGLAAGLYSRGLVLPRCSGQHPAISKTSVLPRVLLGYP